MSVILLNGAGAAEPSDDEGESSRIRPGVLHFDASELALELEGVYERRRVGSDRAGTFTHRNRDDRFQESINLRLHGDIVDPLLLGWDASLNLGLAQERFRESIGPFSREDSETGLLREYDVSLDFLPAKPFSASAYGRRIRDRIPRRFLPSLLEERTEAGVTGFLRLGSWEAKFGFEGSEVDRTGNRIDRDDERLEMRRFFADAQWTIRPSHSLSLSYDHQREESTYQGSLFEQKTTRDMVRLEHDLAFGSQRQHRLHTFIRLNDEQGDLARDEFEVNPTLTLRHSDSLRTIYRYSFYRLDQGAVSLDRHKADVQAVWEPDPTLRLTGNAFWLRESVQDDVETYQYGGSGDLSYRRPHRFGELLANVGFHVDQERSIGDADGGVVRGEGHALDPVRPAYLNRPDIVPGSVVAYNANRTRIFIQGTDYALRRAGRRMLVFRMLSGRIAEGEVVFFDYRYRVPVGSRVDTARFDLRLENPFSNGLTPFYALEIRRQDARGARRARAFEDHTERHRLGLRYDRPRWSASGEAEFFDDSVLPYDRFQLETRANVLRNPHHTLDLTAAASWFDFTGDFDRRRVWLIDLGVRQNVVLSAGWSSNLTAVYRWEDDSVDGETNGVDIEYGLRFQRGQLEVDLTVEYDLLTVGEHDEGLAVWLTVRRDLSHLLQRPGRDRS